MNDFCCDQKSIMAGRSIVEYIAEHEGRLCAVCGNTDTSYSHSIWAHTLTVQDYQDLIDRGWRRSGSCLHKPSMDKTCCPPYPIRCNALEFKLSRSHKKVIKKVNRFLNTGIRAADKSETKTEAEVHGGTLRHVVPDNRKHFERNDRELNELPTDKDSDEHSETPKHVVTDNLKNVNCTTENENSTSFGSEPKRIERNESETNDLHEDKNSVAVDATQNGSIDDESPKHHVTSKRVKKSPRPGDGANPNKPTCKKAKPVRRQRNLAKQTSTDDTTKITKDKSLEDFLHEVNENAVHKLEIRLVESGSVEFHTTSKESQAVFERYQQMANHKDSPDDWDLKSFRRVVSDSPLQTEKTEGIPEGRGTFYQHYLLDGKIMAVGVLDILSNCISSVYFYYDPEYHFLSLGTYSALREIAFTRYLHTGNLSMQYYCMGCYIHSCPKLRYKIHYEPSFLSCPQTYKWCPVPQALVKLDAKKYSRLACPDEVDESGEVDLDRVLVLHQRQTMPYMMYKAITQSTADERVVTQYARSVGKICVDRMLLYRQ